MSVKPEQYKHWTATAQQRALDRLNEMRNDAWRPFYCPRQHCDGMPHEDWAWNHARGDQRPPSDNEWLVWLLLSGRGAGKTRAGAEWVHRMSDRVARIALVAATGADARDVLLEGEAGVLTIAAPGKRPEYEPSKRRLTWPNGCVATIFSGEEPDRLRGPEHYAAWLDEACFYPLIQDVWDNLMLGLRLGQTPRCVVTTTPKPRKWLTELITDERTRVSKATTYQNLGNLSPVFAERIVKRYEGTRLGRQELLAEILTDVPGALWDWDMLERSRIAVAPEHLDRIVIGVDPAGSKRTTSDETGIIVAGVADEIAYVLADRSGKYSPHGWASVVGTLYEDYQADAIVVERNYGGDMVRHTLETSGVRGRIVEIAARRSKSLRAEPVVGLYEQDKVKHVGTMSELEEQMATWVPFERDSPDRLDALVYAITYVARPRVPAQVASPLRLVRADAV